MEQTERQASPQISSTSSSRPSEPFAGDSPSPTSRSATPAERLEIGAEVFLIDSTTRNNVPACSSAIGLGVNSIESLVHPQRLFRLPPNKANKHEEQGVFLILRRFIRFQGGGLARFSAATNSNEITDSLPEGPFIYHIKPRSGVGRDMLATATDLVKVRFRQGDWVWLLTEGHGEKRKEKAMVIAGEVLKGNRVYHVHVVDQRCDRLLVPDERLESIVANVA